MTVIPRKPFITFPILFGIIGVVAVIASQPDSDDNQDEVRVYTDADYDRHVEAVRRKLPSGDFTILIEKPFVVIGDESPDQVRRRAKDTIGWAVRHLKSLYFEKDPRHILDIWLFDGKESYETNALKLFGRTPTTPFGYYSSSNRALVMNIATGGGTLVHEIVHPFIEANFPDCPPWFNEGLGSLYEQCREENGIITGRTNWRLRGLRDAIEQDGLPSFRELCEMDSATFFGDDRGDNYAQARYLLYYLQEHDLLPTYYHRFRQSRHEDPSGYATLQAVLGDKGQEMARFQGEWAAWVLRLRFP